MSNIKAERRISYIISASIGKDILMQCLSGITLINAHTPKGCYSFPNKLTILMLRLHHSNQ